MIKRNLMVDLGHSKRFSGAVGVRSEVDWSRDIWNFMQDTIDHGKWNVVLVPDSFGILDLTNNWNLIRRINFINAHCNPARDVVLSIHGNAATRESVRGVTTVYMGGSNYARSEAIKLSKAYSATTGVPIWQSGAFDDRNARFGRIAMVRDTRPLALLIEAGFVTNKTDMEVHPALAAEGITSYLNSF